MRLTAFVYHLTSGKTLREKRGYESTGSKAESESYYDGTFLMQCRTPITTQYSTNKATYREHESFYDTVPNFDDVDNSFSGRCGAVLGASSSIPSNSSSGGSSCIGTVYQTAVSATP